MNGRVPGLVVTLTVMLGHAAVAGAAPVPCGDLARLSLPDTTVTAVEEIAAGAYAPAVGPRLANLPAFCRVALTVSPQIRIEVWLPKDTWNVASVPPLRL